MRYMGSKRRIAKQIIPLIMGGHDPGKWYVEPFAGGMNMIDKVRAPKRIAADSNGYLIAMYRALQNGWVPPVSIDENLYKHVMDNKDQYQKRVVGFVGFGCSFGGKFFGGYARTPGRNYAAESKRNVLKQIKTLQDVLFLHSDYRTLYIPPGSTVYCDPPYVGTTKYKVGIDHDKFWQWCRELKNEGCRVFVSEYNAPADFRCIWEKEIENPLNRKTGVERLFTL